jgi:hypothetical protein
MDVSGRLIRLWGYVGGMLMPAACGALFLCAMAGLVDPYWKAVSGIAFGAWMVGYSVGVPTGELRVRMMQRAGTAKS